MKKYRLWNVFSHGSIVLSVAFLVLFIIDRINPAMEFIGSDQGDWLLLLFCITALVNGVMSAVHLFRWENHAIMREMEAGHGEER